MKMVPINELKRKLGAFVDEAAAGEQIVVTRHNRPVACLLSSDLRYVHVGPQFGSARLEPAFHEPATAGRYLEILKEDREDAEP